MRSCSVKFIMGCATVTRERRERREPTTWIWVAYLQTRQARSGLRVTIMQIAELQMKKISSLSRIIAPIVADGQIAQDLISPFVNGSHARRVGSNRYRSISVGLPASRVRCSDINKERHEHWHMQLPTKPFSSLSPKIRLRRVTMNGGVALRHAIGPLTQIAVCCCCASKLA